MTNKITIGIFSDSFYPMTDGVVMVVDNYARRLAKYANVIVFAPSYFGNKYDDNVFPYKVVRCNSLKVFFLDYSLPTPKLDAKFKKEIAKYKLDIVHIHSPFTLGQAGLSYARKNHVPCVATMHSQYRQDFEKAVKSDILADRLTAKIIKVFNKCDECWAVNSRVAEIYYHDYKYKCLPRVMNNATEMRPVPDLKASRKRINELYKIKDNEKVFIFVGRINTLKNIFFIVDSLYFLKKKSPHLKFKMLFVGTGQDEDKLKEKITELGLTKEVLMCGKITDRNLLADHYARSDLMLFPSIYDASSIVQIEAASQKTPTVFLENTATSATIVDNVNGYLSKNTIEDYTNKIMEILNDKKLYQEVSENCFKDLYKTWDDAVDEAYHLYQELIIKKKERN